MPMSIRGFLQPGDLQLKAAVEADFKAVFIWLHATFNVVEWDKTDVYVSVTL
jgi:hypothetical protein